MPQRYQAASTRWYEHAWKHVMTWDWNNNWAHGNWSRDSWYVSAHATNTTAQTLRGTFIWTSQNNYQSSDPTNWGLNLMALAFVPTAHRQVPAYHLLLGSLHLNSSKVPRLWQTRHQDALSHPLPSPMQNAEVTRKNETGTSPNCFSIFLYGKMMSCSKGEKSGFN